MKRIFSFFTTSPMVLAIVAILAYGLLLNQLGFYWDDLPMSWIRYQLGPEAMSRYFSTNRPVWGLLYQLTTGLLPQAPIFWQIFALILRILTGILVWTIIRDIFPTRNKLALSTALLFLVYPGFNQQPGAYLYSHFYCVLNFFLLSIVFMLRAQRERFWFWTILALLCSALNLWMHEYFFTLEISRLAIIWIFLRDPKKTGKQRLHQTIILWLPYLTIFIIAVLSRLFVFNNQIYEIGGSQAGSTPFNLLTTIPVSLWTVTVTAWSQVFRFPDLAVDGPRATLVYGAITLFVYGLVIFTLYKNHSKSNRENTTRDSFVILGLAVFMLLVAGWPFWLTGVPVSLGFPANRATLSFMFGASLLLVGLLSFLPQRLNWILLAICISLAAGRQFQWTNDFRRDWEKQKELFWQMTWRAPGLQPDTIVVLNEELDFYADNSIGATLNWIYAPDNHSDDLDYVLFYPTNRLQNELGKFEPGLPVKYDYLAAQFEGNTSQIVAFYFKPPGCLRALDPDIDPYNHLIPANSLLRDAAHLSNQSLILKEASAQMPAIYTPEPAHKWCYYFEQADLARQLKQWELVAELGDKAFSLDDYPNDPLERFVFVEGYAHVNEWEKSLDYSQISYKVSKNYVGPLLCNLWDRIEREVPDNQEKYEYVLQAKTLFVCD